MKILFLVFILGVAFALSLSGCAENSQILIDDVLTNTGLELQGYDSRCVQSVRGMVREGRLSPSEGDFLIQQRCKKPEPVTPPQSFEPISPISGVCPICGMVGSPRSGYPGIYYVCPRGHAWR